MKELIRKPVLLWDAADHDAQPYAGTLIYRAADPFAVRLLVPDHDTDDLDDMSLTEIVFARDLLLIGIAEPTGDGAVRVEPHIVDREYPSLTLPVTRDGKEFYTERAPLEDFVTETCALVRCGSERPRVTAELDRWLAEEMA